MARNIEIKARLDNVEAIVPMVAALADQGPVEIMQDDTFFACERGRLKLRVFSDGAVEGLGHFLELEVVLSDGERSEAGVKEAKALMAVLGIRPEQLVEGAYLDLLTRRNVQ